MLAAVYAAGQLDASARPAVMKVVRRAIGWQGDTDRDDVLLSHLSSSFDRFALSSSTQADPIAWALEVLGFEADAEVPDVNTLRKTVRNALREAHPDVGGDSDDAADRIAELTEARRILLA